MKRQRDRHFPSAQPEAAMASPNMSVKRQKTSTAAFAASQPLFDTLRSTRDRLPEQGMYLTVATNVVQQLHVGLKIEDGKNDIERHAKYMDAIVEAWRCATDMYCDVFSQLATITAEKPEEGRSAAASHVEFEKMLESAQLAQKLAKEYTLAKEKPGLPILENVVKIKPEPKAATESEDSEEESKSSSQLFPPSQATPTPASKKKSNPNTKYDKSGSKLLWENGKLKVPVSELTKVEKREWDLLQKRAKRPEQKKKIAAIVSKDKQAQSNGVSNNHTPQQVNGTSEPSKVPGVEYEDPDNLAAEAAARSKAKEEAKRAKKAERKRKRESGDSFVNGDVGDAAAHNPEVAAEKPKKKKAKKSDDATTIEQAAATPEVNGSSSKRKGSVDAGSANGIEPLTKKQKKAKAKKNNG